MLIEAARRIDPELCVANRSPWKGIEDKSQITGIVAKLKVMAAWITSYPVLLYAYLRMPKHDIVIIPYLGNIDVLLLWPFARLRGARICWDMFISVYDTVVEDRKLVQPSNWGARLLYQFERWSLRAADLVLMDTREHARYVAQLYQVPASKVKAVWVGAETGLFHRTQLPIRKGPVHVLFYGQFIPLHGLETLVDAIHVIQSTCYGQPSDLRFTIIGSGQEAAKIDRLIAKYELRDVCRIAWVNYTDLPAAIAEADICLGVFAGEGKAGRVIPNKMFQILAAGRPLITRDSSAARELVQPGAAIRLVCPGDSADLARHLSALARDLRDPVAVLQVAKEAAQMPSVDVGVIAAQLRTSLEILK
ncbi:hypothetical protein M527_13425 [Sphingobium indicum IP26]|uniref:glycosyltransferase n=1 Tax=Sphingobium indicum TaxID=332055 RepID=UPI00037FB208|nr:hypothetical protein M527_13425 [Sphingobium indicum IP26]